LPGIPSRRRLGPTPRPRPSGRPAGGATGGQCLRHRDLEDAWRTRWERRRLWWPLLAAGDLGLATAEIGEPVSPASRRHPGPAGNPVALHRSCRRRSCAYCARPPRMPKRHGPTPVG